jgi:hypothetical protein
MLQINHFFNKSSPPFTLILYYSLLWESPLWYWFEERKSIWGDEIQVTNNNMKQQEE